MSSSTSPEPSLPARIPSIPLHSSNLGFFTATVLVYTIAVIAATLTLNPYFSQTWDVQTFVQAARALTGANSFDLYTQSRASQTWPYAYPPLHALVVALALFVGDAVRLLPEYVWARLPALIADIGVAFALYRVVLKRSNDAMPARIALLVWLFSPVTFYDTAVQGHFESEWILFVVLAYLWLEEGRGVFQPSVALAIAVLFKQVAVLYAVPVWIAMSLRASEGREAISPVDEAWRLLRSLRSLAMTFGANASPWRRVAASVALFALITGAVSLPFLLNSGDYVYMNLTYVENVPVQTQSWLVGVLGLTRDAPDALTSDFFLIRYHTWITLTVVAILSFIAARRGWSLWLTGTLVTLAFFLLSKKVMGYYYVMLYPFLLAEFLPRRRFDLVLAALVATAFIALSPYYAAWTNHAHWWVYAVSGGIASAFFVGLFWLTTDGRRQTADGTANYELRITNSSASIRANPRPLLIVTLGLFTTTVSAALLQPLIASAGSPIRAPIVAAGMELNAAIAFSALIVLTLGALGLIARVTRGLGELPRAAWVSVLIFAPVVFAEFTLTKETTAILELILKGLGI